MSKCGSMPRDSALDGCIAPGPRIGFHQPLADDDSICQAAAPGGDDRRRRPTKFTPLHCWERHAKFNVGLPALAPPSGLPPQHTSPAPHHLLRHHALTCPRSPKSLITQYRPSNKLTWARCTSSLSRRCCRLSSHNALSAFASQTVAMTSDSLPSGSALPARPSSPSGSLYAMSDDEEGDYNTITHTETGRGVKLLFSKSKVRVLAFS